MAVRRARLGTKPAAPMALRGPLARSWPSIVATAAAAVLNVWLAWHAGGYFPQEHLGAGAVALAIVALVFVLRPPLHAWSAPALVAVAALAGYAVWTGVSLAWTSSPVTGLEDMQRDLCYVGLLGLGLVAAGSGRHARHLVRVVLAVGFVIVLGSGV